MEQSPAARFIDVLGRLGYKTQQQIADLLQIARPTAGTIVRQEREPSFADVSRLKQEHDEVNIDWIFTGRGEAIPSRKPTPPTPTNEMEPATSAAASDSASALSASRGGLPIPGEATPQQADFVGKLIDRLESEIAGYQEREVWYQEMLKKPSPAPDATWSSFAPNEISLRPTACTTAKAKGGKVIVMYAQPAAIRAQA